VRIVHGRGTGAQRAVVRRLLASLDWVEWFGDAPPTSGGWGATQARLRPLEKN
jgi:dsDNA-specific endonuclease/ATPase MutS2